MFTRVGQARDDGGKTTGALTEFVIVKGVQGLSQFEGEVVSHIDDIVARALPDQLEAMLHPEGRGCHDGIAQQGQREAGVQIRLADIDIDLSRNWRALRQEVEGGIAHIDSEDGGNFAGDADHAEAAREIRREFDIQQDIAEHLDQGHTRDIALVVIHNDHAFVLV